MTKWCEDCDRPVEGEFCEVCGSRIQEVAKEPIPWRWRFFIFATAIYVIWRIYQLVSWLAH